MSRFQLTAGRSVRLAVFLFIVLAIAALWIRQRNSPPAESDTDARIAFYSARIGGRGTYPAYARLGAAYLQKARETSDAKFYPLAEDNLKKSNEFQINFEATRSLAALSLDLHRFADALRFAWVAAETMPGDIESRGLLFDAQLAIGKTKDAEAALQKLDAAARQLKSNAGANFAALTRRANLQELRGDLRGALLSMEQACAEAQQSNMSRSTQAWCNVRLGSLKLLANCDSTGAEAAYQRALALLPNYFLAREHLAELRAAQGKREEAAHFYQELIAESASPSHRLALADVLDADNQKDAAALERAAALKELQRQRDAGDRGHLLELASLLLDTEPASNTPGTSRREALRIAEAETRIRRDLFALDALAWAQFRNGQAKEALANMEEALKEGTMNSGVRLHAAEIFLAAGQKDRAAKLFAEIVRCTAALTPGERAAAEQLKPRVVK